MTGRPLSELHSCRGKGPEGHQQKKSKTEPGNEWVTVKIQGFYNQNYHMWKYNVWCESTIPWVCNSNALTGISKDLHCLVKMCAL